MINWEEGRLIKDKARNYCSRNLQIVVWRRRIEVVIWIWKKKALLIVSCGGSERERLNVWSIQVSSSKKSSKSLMSHFVCFWGVSFPFLASFPLCCMLLTFFSIICCPQACWSLAPCAPTLSFLGSAVMQSLFTKLPYRCLDGEAELCFQPRHCVGTPWRQNSAFASPR